MAEGKDKIARSLLDLEPTAIVDFYKIYPDIINKPTLSINIHGGSIFNQPIEWQGVKYTPVPIEAEGFELTSDGRLPRPKIRVANKDYLVTALLQNNYDFKNAQIIRKRTFVKYLDDVNFDGGNPFGEADSTAEISEEKYVIGQKTQENKILVEFELTSPLDLENFELNHRRILGKYCYWMYRGQGCNYAGPPIERENGSPFSDSNGQPVAIDFDAFNPTDGSYLWRATKQYTKSDIIFLENPKVLVSSGPGLPSEPMKIWYVCVQDNIGKQPENNPTYWQKDGCSKKINSCKKRFSSVVEQIVSEVDIDQDYIEITGQYVSPSYLYTGYFQSKDSNLTNFYNGDFTIGMFIDPSSFNRGAGYFDTRDDVDNSFGLEYVNTYSSICLRAPYGSTHTFYNTALKPASMDKTLILIQHDSAAKTLYVKSLTDPNAIITNVNKTRNDFNFNSINCLTLGAEINGAAILSANAKYYNLAIWEKMLSDDEIKKLSIFDKANEFRFVRYEYADSSLTGTNSNLLAWYQNITTSPTTLFQDSHVNGYHLTGFGDFATNEETYTAELKISKIQSLNSYLLPFGGFPGTDGFSYQA